MKNTIGRWVVAVAGAGLLALAGAAGAEEGMGVMVDKDILASTVTLMDGTVLRVSDSTRITRRNHATRSRETISFGQLTHAAEFAGGVEVRGEHQIEWSGSRRGGDAVAADRIEVLGVLVE